MNEEGTTLVSVKGMSTLERARFAPGMLLHHEDLQQLSAYTAELNRLLFRSLLGCGVVCGLVVRAANPCGWRLTVGAGLAIDGLGNPIHVPRDHTFALDSECGTLDQQKALWVVLKGTRRRCAPRAAVCGTDDDQPVSAWTRERDAYEIRVVGSVEGCGCDRKPEQKLEVTPCGCADPTDSCHEAHYDGDCPCACDDGSGCDCEGVVLARLARDEKNGWKVDHRFRRFIRPVLMRDPQVAKEANEAAAPPAAAPEASAPSTPMIGARPGTPGPTTRKEPSAEEALVRSAPATTAERPDKKKPQ